MAYVEREIEKDLGRWLEEREMLAIRGPRQSGKTTLLERMKEMALSRGIDEKQIHYISFEDDLVRLKFEKDAKEFVRSYIAAGKNYFLFDEVQYVNDAGKKLKLLFDSFPEVKFVFTGSSSFDLTNVGALLVGRVVFFDLLTFNFKEFLRAKGERFERIYNENRIDVAGTVKIKEMLFVDELNKHLHEYLTYGGYPRIVLEEEAEKKKELLANLFTTYVEKDVVSMYGKKYRDGGVKLLKSFAAMLTSTVQYETLSQTAGLKTNEVKGIMPLLQDSFVIFITPPFYRNLITELRKNPKVYFVDYGIRNHLLENFDSVEFDGLYENFVHNELKRKGRMKYWRTTSKTEVDFVLEHGNEIIPIEVKTTAKTTKALRSFISEYAPKRAFVANLKETGREKINGCEVFTVPFVLL